jgi:hypothetical protein
MGCAVRKFSSEIADLDREIPMVDVASSSRCLPSLTLVSTKTTPSQGTAPGFSASREVIILSSLLVALQIADLVLTAVGVSLFGVNAEGNPLIRGLMQHMGILPALVIVKSVAICIIGMLVLLARTVPWVPVAMRAVAAIYILAAIIPWSGILLTQWI